MNIQFSNKNIFYHQIFSVLLDMSEEQTQ